MSSDLTSWPLIDVPGLSENTDDAFRRALVSLALDRGLNPDHLATVIAFETGGTFSPSIKNPESGAVGLIQFTPIAVEDMAAHGHLVTMGELGEMGAIEQLVWVGHYFDLHRQPVTLADHYLAVLAPARMGQPPSAVVYSEPSKAYLQNLGLDDNLDGQITVAEATVRVEEIQAAGRMRGRLSVSLSDPDTPAVEKPIRRGNLARGVVPFLIVLAVGIGLFSLKR